MKITSLVKASGAVGPALFLISMQPVPAHQQPSPKEVEALKSAGLWESRLRFIDALGNSSFSEPVLRKAKEKVKRAQMAAEGFTESEIDNLLPRPAPPPAWRGVPTTGAPKTLTLLIDFNDYRVGTLHPELTAQRVGQNIYGPGTDTSRQFAPFESVNAYFKRASHNKLDWRGDILGWYNLPNNRSSYEPTRADDNNERNRALFNVVTQVLRSYDATTNYAQYDNNNDGYIDSINVLWTGPNGAWATFWWAYQWSFFTPEASTTTFDGKKLRAFTWEKLETRANNTDFDPRTMIHETGHLLGLPDLYDYKPNEGQEGGVGGLDIMDGNSGNPNGFFRWIMEWIQPQIFGTGAPASVTLSASGDTASDQDKAVVLFPNAQSTPFQEFFMIENRHRSGNDGGLSRLTSDGLVIWHIDATLTNDGSDFAFSNSDVPSATAHKLVQLVQADGLNQIEVDGGGRADAGDYYLTGRTLGPSTNPSSRAYNNAQTNIVVSDISANGISMTATIGFQGATSTPDLRDAGANFHALSATTRDPGQPLTISGRVTNAGAAAAAAFQVAFYASADRTVDPRSDILLGTKGMPSLAANASAALDTTLDVPASMPPGTFSVGWVLDSQSGVTESIEGNNSVVIQTPQLSITGTGVPEISVRGAGIEIPDGTTSVRANDSTEFGSVALGQSIERTFSIVNLGSAGLALTNPAITLGGAAATHFRVALSPAPAIAPSTSSDFIVAFDPQSAGSFAVDVTISSNDADEGQYQFRIAATGLSSNDDHGNTPGTATAVAAGSQTNGVLEQGGDLDYFRVVAPAAGTLRAVSSGTTDVTCYILDAAGTELAFDDDSGGARNFDVAVPAQPGTYYLRVAGYLATTTAAYGLNVSFTAGAADDHANTLAGATELSFGTERSGRFEAGGDLDVFRVVLAVPGVLTAQTYGTTDTFARLLAANGAELALDDDGGNIRNFALNVYLAAGTYYIAASGYDLATLGSYTLRADFVPGIPSDDHGNTVFNPTPIFPYSQTAGAFELPGDLDVFQMFLDRPGYLAVHSGGETDAVLSIYDGNGFLGFTDDDSGPQSNFEGLVYLPAGFYYLAVGGYEAGVVGTYELYCTFTPDFFGLADDYDDTPAGGAVIQGSSGSISGRIDAVGDTDYFQINVGGPGLLTVSTDGFTDTFGALFSPEGLVMTRDDDSGANSNFLIPRVVEQGTYYVRVSGFEFTEIGDYTLRWTYVAGPIQDDHGNNLGTATAIAAPGSAAGQLEVGGDVDVFRVSFGGAGRLRFFTEGGTDTFGELLDASGIQVATNDDGSDLNFEIAGDVAAGTYYVVVTGYDGGTAGAYTLRLEFSGGGVSSPAIGLSVSSVHATADSGSAATSFQLRNAGGGSLDYSVSGNPPWMTVSPPAGSSGGEWDTINLGFNAAGLAAGVQTATLSITAPGAAPATIQVALTVSGQGTPAPEITTLQLSANRQQLSVSWRAEIGASYHIESSGDLKGWALVTGSAIQATATTAGFDIPLVPADRERYFRIVRDN